MLITSVRAIPVRIPRNWSAAAGTAGSPTALHGAGSYRWSTAYPVLYSVEFETALIRVGLENGLEGWGESQAPLTPEIVCTIIDQLLRPVLIGQDFDGSTMRIAELWDRMYSTMRVRGHTGSFMLDAISGVDLALWDLAGKLAGQPVSRLIRPDAKASVPAYLSGTSGATVEERAAFAKTYQEQGIGLVKLYFESRWEDLLHLADRLPNGLRFAVDALWHLPPASAAAMGADLDRRTARWLECPFYPEQIEEHEALAARITTPIALGESYRTVAELKPFATLASILQPDLGRSGLTESLRIASAYQREIIPHVSIAMGPQIAAAVHFAAVADRCALCEFNPSVLEMANRFLREPIRMEDGHYLVPAGPGLGIEWNSAFDKLV